MQFMMGRSGLVLFQGQAFSLNQGRGTSQELFFKWSVVVDGGQDKTLFQNPRGLCYAMILLLGLATDFV